MATIYLRHPVHGTKVATMIEEAEADAQNGWIEYNLNTPIKTEAKCLVGYFFIYYILHLGVKITQVF